MEPKKPKLTVKKLLKEAKTFAEAESVHPEPTLYGAVNPKQIGTYIERKFKTSLAARYEVMLGNTASGLDLPGLEVDIKVTSISRPQSSSPFKSARQKIFGLGYSLLVFVYSKNDDEATKTATLNMLHTIFVEKERTADYQTTTGLNMILARKGDADEIVAFLRKQKLFLDEVEAYKIAAELLAGTLLTEGHLTISNALQWRPKYSRVIKHAGSVSGIIRVR